MVSFNAVTVMILGIQMSEIAYIIDKETSEKENVLAIKLVEAEREGYTLKFLPSKNVNTLKWTQLSTSKDQDALRALSLKDVKLDNSYLMIPHNQSLQSLKLLASSGKVYYNQKQLVCDFFTPVEFYYVVDNLSVTGRLKFLDQDFDISSCDFIGAGPSPWFIKNHLLKLIQTDVSFKILKQLNVDPKLLTVDKIQESLVDDSGPRIVYLNNSLELLKQTQQPFPLLILKDRSGAFADLWMDYGQGKKFAFHDKLNTSFKRDCLSEKNWENDLLETGFVPKIVGQSHYYCPLDQVSKSLSFLLEIGWNIQDFQGKKVLLVNETHLNLSMESDSIVVRGKIRYQDYEADLTKVAGAFNRRERFVLIGSEAVGLMPEKWAHPGMTEIFGEGEIFADAIKLKRNQVGVLGEVLQNPHYSLDESINKLKIGMNTLSEIPDVPPGIHFKGNLRPYQQQGINWLQFLYTFGFNGILSDDMGLGKTVQVLAFLSQLNTELPILIVMPTSLIFNWKREIERFLPNHSVELYHGPQRFISKDSLKANTIILTSYATLRMDLSFFSTMDFEAVILDEAQAIKNSLTQAAQATYSLRSRFRLLLTGTPIENHLGEIWSHFQFLMPGLLGDEKSFYAEVQAGNSDVRYIQKIKNKIRPFILRRKKNEVAKDLPDCVEQTIWVEMTPSQRQIYEGYLAGIKNNLFSKVNSEGLKKHRLEVFEAILRLRQICCHPLLISGQFQDQNLEFTSGKMEALMQDLENAVAENNKVLIYSQFTSMLQLISKEIQIKNWNYVYLDGSTVDREKVVNQFQNDPDIHLFLISLKAGGTGLNLTAADHVLIFDPWWNEAAELQAINRAHRIGRKSTVFAKRYATTESIEEKMMRLKQQKRLMIDSLLEDEGQAFAQLTLEDFSYLIS